MWWHGPGVPIVSHEVDPMTVVSGKVFDLLGIPVIAGRSFTATDTAGTQPVVMVNQAFARRAWGDSSPIGSRVIITEGDVASTSTVVVGVVRDVRQQTGDEPPQPEVYRSYSQRLRDSRDMAVLLRTTGDPTAVGSAARAAVATIDAAQPVYWLYTLNDIVSQAFGAKRLAVVLLSLFASLALVLSAAGMYGVLTFAVAQQTTDIGVRIALGADRSQVTRDILAAGFRLASLGIVLGIAVSESSWRVASSWLFGVEPPHPAAVMLVSASILFAAGVASFVPARRAARIEPSVALRGV
jgi:putative ABC transport system permease protein